MQVKEHYETIVVGAGPAGVMAAIYASAAGDVLLVDSMSMPREKSCGGMLNEYSQAFLKNVAQIPKSIITEPEWIDFRFFDWDRNIKKATKLRFMNVDRVGFDDWLMGMLPSNVTVLPQTSFTACNMTDFGVNVTLRSAADPKAPEQSVHCAYLIGCDGPRSTVRRQLPVTQLALYKTLQEFVPSAPNPEPYFDCVYSRNIGENYGYGYIIPKGDATIIGSVFFPGSTGCLENHLKAIDEFRKYFNYGAGQVRKREAWTAVKVTSTKDIVGGHGRVLLAGEAGGIMSPSSGEGISFAMNSGKLAGMAVAAAARSKTNGGDALEAYRASLKPIKKNIARRLRYFPVLNSNWGKWLGGSSPDFLVDIVAHRI